MKTNIHEKEEESHTDGGKTAPETRRQKTTDMMLITTNPKMVSFQRPLKTKNFKGRTRRQYHSLHTGRPRRNKARTIKQKRH